MRNKPDFICIGPEKTATTWLFSMLEEHPQVWLTPYKELRFLTEGNLVPEHSMKNLFFNPHWHCKELRRVLIHSVVKLLLWRKTEQFSPVEAFTWVLRYMFGKHSFAWYGDLFRDGKGMICGDITPNYYYIPDERIADLWQHNPNTKVLLFVRNPIERAWSGAMMNLCDHEGYRFEDVTEEQWIKMLNEIFKIWMPYSDVISHWKKFFPNMHIAFFDQLKNEPDIFYRDISGFLEIDCYQPKNASKVVGKGVGKMIPESIRKHLEKQYLKEIQFLIADNISDYPKKWL